jgi:hypothetical protein
MPVRELDEAARSTLRRVIAAEREVQKNQQSSHPNNAVCDGRMACAELKFIHCSSYLAVFTFP